MRQRGTEYKYMPAIKTLSWRCVVRPLLSAETKSLQFMRLIFSVSIMVTHCDKNDCLLSFGISLFVNWCSPISCLVASWWKALFINISQALNQCKAKHEKVNIDYFLVDLTTCVYSL